MTQPTGSGNGGSAGQRGGVDVASNAPDADVDVRELTERVYQLFLNDLRVQKKRIYGERR